MKLPSKTRKSSQRARCSVPKMAPRMPAAEELSASLVGLPNCFAMLSSVLEAESGGIRHPDPALSGALHQRKSAIAGLLRDTTRIVAGAQQSGMTIDTGARGAILDACQQALGGLTTNMKAIEAARTASHRRIQTVLQARQRAEGAVLVYGPDGQAKAGGRWTDRRDLAPRGA